MAGNAQVTATWNRLLKLNTSYLFLNIGVACKYVTLFNQPAEPGDL